MKRHFVTGKKPGTISDIRKRCVNRHAGKMLANQSKHSNKIWSTAKMMWNKKDMTKERGQGREVGAGGDGTGPTF